MSNTIANVSEPGESWKRLRGEQLGQAVLRDRAARVANGEREVDNVGDAKRYGSTPSAVNKAVNRAKMETSSSVESLSATYPLLRADSSAVAEIPFYKGVVLGVLLDGVPHVFLKPVLDDLGIDTCGQLRKIREFRWSQTLKKISVQVPGAAQTRGHIVLPTKTLGKLLGNINENKVRPQSRELLIQLQDEVDEVVDRFLTGGRPLTLEMTRQEALRELADRIDREEEALAEAREQARRAHIAEMLAIEAQAHAAEAEAISGYLAERAAKCDAFLKDERFLISVTDMAAVLGGSTRPDMYDFLMEHGVIYKPDAQQGEGRSLRAEWRYSEWAEMIAEEVGHGRSLRKVMVPYFKPRGLEKVYELLCEHGWGVVKYYPANSTKGRRRKGGEIPTKEQVMERAAQYVRDADEVRAGKLKDTDKPALES